RNAHPSTSSIARCDRSVRTGKLTFSSSHFTVCKTCIVNYFDDESNPRCCPICDTAVSKNRPMQSLREDKLKQDIVYKLVPQVFKSKCRGDSETKMAEV